VKGIEIEIGIGPSDSSGSFRVEVLRSPAGEASAEITLDVESLLARRNQLARAVLKSGEGGRSALRQERLLREHGQVLFSALLGAEKVAGRYTASAALAAESEQGLTVVLRTETPTLASLPWEAMYDAATGGYVCRRHQLVRRVPIASPAAPLTVHMPLRIFGVPSSPDGLPVLNVANEQEQLTKALAGLRAENLVEVRWAPKATWAGLQDLLLRETLHVIHFVGHGRFDARLNKGTLALVGDDGRADWVDAERLVDLLRQAHPMPRLAVLNSCSGAVTGAQDLFSGTAAALVRGGISAVVAMQYPISDTAAVAFARGFYAAIACGRGVDDATSSGRVAILGTSARTLEWVAPVVYLRGQDSRLFNLPLKPSLIGAAP
jgi:hypothetical protein